MRNPKDIMVSSYYFHQMAGFLQDPGTFDEFMDKFLEGKIISGKWTDHVKSWRQAELEDRIMFITYEEMVQVKINEMASCYPSEHCESLCLSLCLV